MKWLESVSMWLNKSNKSVSLKRQDSNTYQITGPNGESALHFIVIHRVGRSRASISVSSQGVRLLLPVRAKIVDYVDFVWEQRHWIRDKIKEHDERRSRLAIPWFEPRDGARIVYRGRIATIRLGCDQTTLREQCGLLELCLALPVDASPDRISSLCETFLKKEAKRVIGDIYQRILLKAPKAPKAWQLSGAKTRWGVCTSRETIRFAWRLIFVPDDLIGYVIAHELAHLVHLNHASAFWQVVSEIDPDWQEHREKLKAYSMDYFPF